MRFALACVIAILGLSLLSSPASAEATGTFTFVSPTPGSVQPNGFHTVQLHFSGMPDGDYHISIYGCVDNGYYDTQDFTTSSSGELDIALEVAPIVCHYRGLTLELYTGLTEDTENGPYVIGQLGFSIAPPESDVSRAGVDTTRRGHARHCGFRALDHRLRLTCRGGRYAIARYAFTVPSFAHDFRWRVRGRAGCCKPGAVSKSGALVRPTRYVIKVKVTRQRSYTVRWVDLAWSNTI